MTLVDIQGLLPLVVLGTGAVVLMLQISIKRHMGWSYAITLLFLLLGPIGAWYGWSLPCCSGTSPLMV